MEHSLFTGIDLQNTFQDRWLCFSCKRRQTYVLIPSAATDDICHMTCADNVVTDVSAQSHLRATLSADKSMKPKERYNN